MSPLGLAVVIVVGTLLLLVIVFALLRRVLMNQAAAARERFPNAQLVIPGANFYGQESAGVTQLRGNGTLVLTDSEIYFEKLMPRREYRIPLSTVQAVENPSSFLGKTNFRPLIKVVFLNDAGQTDSIAWLVPDVEGLTRAIRAVTEQG